MIQCAEPGWRDALERFGAFDLERVLRRATPRSSGASAATATSTRRSPGSSACAPRASPRSRWTTRSGARCRACRPTSRWPGDDDPSKTEAIQATLGWIFSAPELTDLEADQRRMADLRANRPTSTTMSDAELVAWFRGHAPELRRMFAEHLYIIVLLHGAPRRDPGRVHRDRRPDAGDDARLRHRRRRLGRAVVRLLGDGPHGAGVGVAHRRVRRRRRRPARAAPGAPTTPTRRASSKAFDDFIYEFGSRGPNEWETSAPSWETDPELPLAAIDRMRLADDDQAPRRHQEAMAAAREAAIPGVLAAVEGDPETHGQLSAALAAAPVFLAGRERTKTNIIRLVNEMRVGSHALGQRMVERGYYTKPTSGSMLSDDELDQFLADPTPWVDTIKEREAQYELLFDLEPPFVFAGEVPPLRTWAERETEPTPVADGHDARGHPRLPGPGHRARPRGARPVRPHRARARRRAHRADHRPGVDAAVRPRRRRRRRRRRPAQPRRDRVPASSASPASSPSPAAPASSPTAPWSPSTAPPARSPSTEIPSCCALRARSLAARRCLARRSRLAPSRQSAREAATPPGPP